MTALNRLRSALNEMAAPYREVLDHKIGKGNYEVWVDAQRPSYEGGATLALIDGDVWVVDRDLYRLRDNHEMMRAYRLPGALVIVSKTEPGDRLIKIVRKLLVSYGWKDVTSMDAHRGKAVYFSGETEEGKVEEYSGTVYHGTDDWEFFRTVEDSTHLGHGSHLRSLQDGDAFSVTPSFRTALSFTSNSGMVLEFKANLTIYFVSKFEEDIDDVVYPPECDAVAIPHNKYTEDEIAVLSWSDNLRLVAVHLWSSNRGMLRVPVDESRIRYHGEFSEYLKHYCDEVFGSTDDLLEYAGIGHDGGNYKIVDDNGHGKELCLEIENDSLGFKFMSFVLGATNENKILLYETDLDDKEKTFISSKGALSFLKEAGGELE
jgi:hypothetical protein